MIQCFNESMCLQVRILAIDWSHLEQVNGFSPVWIFSWHFQSTTIFKWLVTFGTGKCPLFFVNPFMLFQRATLAEWLVTFGTCKCFLFFVDPLIFSQRATLAECLVTFQTGKWPLSFVDPFMLFQSTTICKWLVTFETGNWLFSCVDLLMTFSKYHYLKITGHIWHMQMLSFLCGSFNALSKSHSGWMSLHISNR